MNTTRMPATSDARFAFGQPVLPRPPSAASQRDTYVLGAYPSGLHVYWTPPPLPGASLRPIRAMIVDNEPKPFWDGADVVDHFARWCEDVAWDPTWGEVRLPSEGSNGPSGDWVTHHVLKPLGLVREDVCISDVLDTARLNEGQARRIADTYDPVAKERGLPACTLAPTPAGEAGIVREARDGHLERLKQELRNSKPSRIVTLGNAALRVMEMLLQDVNPDPGKALRPDTYGQPVTALFEGRTLVWIPLVHPRSGERTPRWRDVHDAWEPFAQR